MKVIRNINGQQVIKQVKQTEIAPGVNLIDMNDLFLSLRPKPKK